MGLPSRARQCHLELKLKVKLVSCPGASLVWLWLCLFSVLLCVLFVLVRWSNRRKEVCLGGVEELGRLSRIQQVHALLLFSYP